MYLSFKGKVYQQVHGTAMGSPALVVVANLVMEDIEQKVLSTFHTCRLHTPPHFWRWYVDDTCTVLPVDLVDLFHNHLNGTDSNIQFAVEKESAGQLPFLDILLTREDNGSVSTSVYRKATHTNKYLSFQSHHPAAHKRAVVKTLLHRAEPFRHQRWAEWWRRDMSLRSFNEMDTPWALSADTPVYNRTRFQVVRKDMQH